MKEEEPVFKDMTRELGELLAYLDTKRDSLLDGELPKGAFEMLETLELEVELFKLVGEQMAKEGGGERDLTKKDVRLQKKLEQLKEIAGGLKEDVEKKQKIAKRAEKKKPKKLSSKERKKKFKRLGGEGDWKPV